jgi:uncharacterized protein (TIGR00290 family)
MLGSATVARAWMSWSSGKDSTTALAAVRADPEFEVVGLLSTVNGQADRVAMHAVRRTLLAAQAERLDLPLHVVEIPSPCSNQAYEERMAAAVTDAIAQGVEVFVFGDLFLTDIRAYREQSLAGVPVRAHFPIWNRPTDELARDMVASGLRAIVTCVDLAQLPASFAGRDFDADLLADLPSHIDPCGERGEFHTFVWDGPGFSRPIGIERGDVIHREGFAFCDVYEAP